MSILARVGAMRVVYDGSKTAPSFRYPQEWEPVSPKGVRNLYATIHRSQPSKNPTSQSHYPGERCDRTGAVRARTEEDCCVRPRRFKQEKRFRGEATGSLAFFSGRPPLSPPIGYGIQFQGLDTERSFLSVSNEKLRMGLRT